MVAFRKGKEQMVDRGIAIFNDGQADLRELITKPWDYENNLLSLTPDINKIYGRFMHSFAIFENADRGSRIKNLEESLIRGFEKSMTDGNRRKGAGEKLADAKIAFEEAIVLLEEGRFGKRSGTPLADGRREFRDEIRREFYGNLPNFVGYACTLAVLGNNDFDLQKTGEDLARGSVYVIDKVENIPMHRMMEIRSSLSEKNWEISKTIEKERRERFAELMRSIKSHG